MRTEQLLRRLVIAATFVVAALIFAPTGAYAHGGHPHATTAEQVVKADAARSIDAHLIRTSLRASETAPGLTNRSGNLGSVLPAHTSKSPQSCPGGCCHSFGTGCCAAYLTPPMEIGPPTLSCSRFDIVVFGGAGITPDALPEPPKSLV